MSQLNSHFPMAPWLSGLRGGAVLAELLLETYGHHHPDFLQGAANSVTSKHRVSLAESVADLKMLGKKGKWLMFLGRSGRTNLRPLRSATKIYRIAF